MAWESFKPDTTITPEQRIWCADNLDHLATTVSLKEERVELWTSPEGHAFRLAFKITCAPAHSDRFVIQLRAGASRADLDRAHRLIKHAKAGFFGPDMWEAVTFTNGSTGWIMRSALEDGDVYQADELKPCTESLCVSGFHAYYEGELGESCELEPIQADDRGYIVYGERPPGGEWQAWADTDRLPEGVAGLKAVRDLANDFAWMQGECERLNVGYLKVAA